MKPHIYFFLGIGFLCNNALYAMSSTNNMTAVLITTRLDYVLSTRAPRRHDNDKIKYLLEILEKSSNKDLFHRYQALYESYAFNQMMGTDEEQRSCV